MAVPTMNAGLILITLATLCGEIQVQAARIELLPDGHARQDEKVVVLQQQIEEQQKEEENEDMDNEEEDQVQHKEKEKHGDAETTDGIVGSLHQQGEQAQQQQNEEQENEKRQVEAREEAVVRKVLLSTTGASCSSITDRWRCCHSKDGRRDNRYGGQTCVFAKSNTFTSGHVCEPECWAEGRCGSGWWKFANAGNIASCDNPVDCQLSAWREWSSCSKTCGGGTITRSRSVVRNAANGGRACESLTQSRPCNSQSCQAKCTDTPGWTNGERYTCEQYSSTKVWKGPWCRNAKVVPGSEWTLGSKYKYPEKNCCVCGKKIKKASFPRPTYADRKVHSFNGATRQLLPPSAGMRGAHSRSVSVFVKTNRRSFCVFSQGTHTVNSNLNLCASSTNTNGGFSGGLTIWVHNMGYHVLGSAGLRSAQKLTNGNWHQYAISYSRENQGVRFYVDGKLVGKVSVTRPIEVGSDAAYYGGSTANSGAWGLQWFSGKAKHLKVYNGVAISAKHVEKLYNNVSMCTLSTYRSPIHWCKQLTQAGIPLPQQNRVSRRHHLWYYKGRSTGVAYGISTELCSPWLYYCAGGNVYGSAGQQARAIKTAIDHGGVYPYDPVPAPTPAPTPVPDRCRVFTSFIACPMRRGECKWLSGATRCIDPRLTHCEEYGTSFMDCPFKHCAWSGSRCVDKVR